MPLPPGHKLDRREKDKSDKGAMINSHPAREEYRTEFFFCAPKKISWGSRLETALCGLIGSFFCPGWPNLDGEKGMFWEFNRREGRLDRLNAPDPF
jgi:hypothetical protein